MKKKNPSVAEVLLIVMMVVTFVVGLVLYSCRQEKIAQTPVQINPVNELRQNDRLLGIYENDYLNISFLHDPGNLNEGEFLKIIRGESGNLSNTFGRFDIKHQSSGSAQTIFVLSDENGEEYLEQVDEATLRGSDYSLTKKL